MPDPRFFEDLGPITLAGLAEAAGATLADPAQGDRLVRAVSILAGAGADTVTFLSDGKRRGELATSKASACFIAAKYADALPANCAALITESPQRSYALAAARLHRPRFSGRDAIAPSAEVEEGVLLGAGVAIGPGAQIGRGTRIGANAVIGPGVAIGRDCDISANVTIGFALVGDRVRILVNAVIGEPGFGATAGTTGLIDIPQLGRVILQDGVTIGAGCCIDRGAFDDTVIGENTKIDNMVQIAHNVRVGRNCAIAAQVGVSGSVTIGDGAQLGGRVGIADHIDIGRGARLAGAAGVMQDVPAGETWGGFPAKPMRQWLREAVWVTKAAGRKGDEG
ncbi:MAG: UDP-3-O-(3-hydroxymyristoyl)glucosamine N-acyltransferase [Phenylobacterium sp.]